MDFLKFARGRYSVRSYSSQQVEPEKIQKILDASHIAPTAVNHQPQKIYILKSEEALSKIRTITDSTYNAPVVFLICADTERCWKSPFLNGTNSAVMDASIVCTHMMLEATDLGLGSVWVLAFDPRKVSETFHLPDHIKPICLLPVGYPAADAKPHPTLHNAFRAQEDVVAEL